jgi:hypothetical protein
MTPTAKPNPNIIPSANTIKIATTIVRFIGGSASAAPARWPRSRLGNLSVSHVWIVRNGICASKYCCPFSSEKDIDQLRFSRWLSRLKRQLMLPLFLPL